MRKKTASTARYEAASFSGEWVQTSLDYTAFNIAQWVQSNQVFRNEEDGEFAATGSYLGMAAQYLPCAVFGAPIGAEGNMGRTRSPHGRSMVTMLISEKLAGDTGPILRYHEESFGEHFEQDSFGYMNYTKMLDAPLPDPGWNSWRSALFKKGDRFPYTGALENDKILRLPSGLMVAMPPSMSAQRPS